MSEPWTRAAIIPGGPGFAEAVARAAALGFTHVEVEALVERPEEHRLALADAGVFVACADLGTEGFQGDIARRRAALERLQRLIGDAARLGAPLACLSPPGEELMVVPCFLEGCQLLAHFAARRMARLAVGWPDGIEGTSLALHAPGPEAIRRAGSRLAHVRLQSKELPPEVAAALQEVGYRGVVALPLPQ
jgi:sugar phosphate isomerase/epimerase